MSLSADDKEKKKYIKYKIEGLDEQNVYSDMAKEFIEPVSECVRGNFAYAFTEILNNAINHSDGENVWVDIARNEYRLSFCITDDGVGIFSKVAGALNLYDKRHAILELAKGKFTTDPASHTGEGIFFSSKCGDMFKLYSDGLVFESGSDSNSLTDTLANDHERKTQAGSVTNGTMVIFEIEMDHSKTLEKLINEFTDAPENYGFSKTMIPIHLLEYGDKTPVFVSRSQAKRLLTRVDRFETVVLDFTGVKEIGQGFADEIFRVFKLQHPNVELAAANCSESVEFMIKHVSGSSKNQPKQI